MIGIVIVLINVNCMDICGLFYVDIECCIIDYYCVVWFDVGIG